MAENDVPVQESFLPRILSVFYAIFDPRRGPKIVYQVPEGSIGVPDAPTLLPQSSTASLSPSPIAAFPSSPNSPFGEPISNVWASTIPESRQKYSSTRTSRFSPSASRNTSGTPTPTTRPATATDPLFDFNSISEYVIPKSQLCGKLVLCNTPHHRILGFPVVVTDKDYYRNTFRFNVCFVFDRQADLSCYEPVVRKIGRVLMACETEFLFLSSITTSPRMYQIIEQLFEDLNSYSETSIPIDSFNSIELKIFPFYPNPPKVEDWQVPVPLLNLKKRMDDSWDLTMTKVIPHVNAVNHVRKISDLADASPELTRQCIEHLLFYQCILLIDIFQYTNMYTLKPTIQWLADDPSVQSECGPYVMKPGFPIPPFPTLLTLYSRLKLGKTLHVWIEENNIAELGIDVRRFITFGVIKGFLRRIRRWPVLVWPLTKDEKKDGDGDKEKEKEKGGSEGTEDEEDGTKTPMGPFAAPSVAPAIGMKQSLIRTASSHSNFSNPVHLSPSSPSPLSAFAATRPRHASIISTLSQTSTSRGLHTQPRPRKRTLPPAPSYPPQLPALLDGTRHEDELCTMFRVGWVDMQKYLYEIGNDGGNGKSANGEKKEKTEGEGAEAGEKGLGRVRIIYR